MPAKGGGLAGISVGTTSISTIDGQEGKLWYRGYAIEDLAAHATFEETTYLLWHGELPTWRELKTFKESLNESREIPDHLDRFIAEAAKVAEPMDFLRTAVSMLGLYDPDADNHDAAALERKAIRLTAQLPTIIAAYDRYRNGLEPMSPDATLDHAANFLYMLHGKKPDDEMAHDFDVAILLHADHQFNASTFSARVTASTLSDMHSAITSAVGTLRGPLHGGANERVMRMLDEIIESGADPRVWVQGRLQRKERIMGFGHRVYRTLDPRARPLGEMSERLGQRAGDRRFYELSREIQKIMKDEKGLDANVDFYSASTYHAMGIPTDLMTPIFALARVAGWTAHVMEQQAANKLIRPDADYVGPAPRAYVPLEERGE